MCAQRPDTTTDPLQQALDAGASILTPNRRLARHLRRWYVQQQRRQGTSRWRMPDILPWSAWLLRSWQVHAEKQALAGKRPPLLLSDDQERRLWEQIVAASPEGSELLKVTATARVAQQAWQLSCSWLLPPDKEGNEDQQAFHRWAGQFEQRCEDSNRLDQSRLIPHLQAALESGDWQAPGHLLLLGFDHLTPRQSLLLEAIRQRGGRCDEAQLPEQQGHARTHGLADAPAEIRAAVRWASDCLAEDSRQSIGIVIPDLSARRDMVRRELDRVLRPAAAGIAPLADEPPYNISLGRPLGEVPAVFAALLWLKALTSRLTIREWSRLLRSPYFQGADEEREARGLFDARLRRRGEPNQGLRAVRGLAEKLDAEQPVAVPLLQRQLVALEALRASLPARQGVFAWGRAFARCLELAGWPGTGEDDESADALIEAWHGLLSRFAALDSVCGELGLGEALSLLRRLAGESLFQSGGSDEAPIQVLGILEAAGLSFDRLWVMGLHDEVWPPAPQPNPFLPLAEQRRLGLPHASAERELEFARLITRRLVALTRADAPVIFSWPEREGERELRPSPLLAEFPPLADDQPLAPAAEGWLEQIHHSAALQPYRDEQGPSLGEGEAITGGTALFRDQAACPFRAFARHRLHSAEPEEPADGLDSLERGNLLHRVLELAWGQLESLEGLRRHDEQSLYELCRACAQRAVSEAARYRPRTLSGRFSELEQDRLLRLAMEWLRIERERPPFRVLAMEKREQVSLGGLPVNTRIDRIDELEDGSRMVIDYKTGRSTPSSWLGERPDEPQLPLYAVTSRPPPEAIAFGVVRHGEMGLRGLGDNGDGITGIKAADALEAGGWGSQLDQWRTALEGLAEDFRAGVAMVDPRDEAKTCQYCELQPLCRIADREAELDPPYNGGNGSE